MSIIQKKASLTYFQDSRLLLLGVKLKVFKNIVQFGLSEILNKLVPLITALLLAKSLGAEDFGKLSLLLILNEISFIVISNNVSATFRVNYFTKNIKEFNRLIKEHYSYSLLMFMIMTLLFIVAAVYFEYTPLIILPLIAIFRAFSNGGLAILQCKGAGTSYLLVQLLYSISFLIILYLSFELGIISWFIGITSATLIQFIAVVHFNAKTDNSTNYKWVTPTLATAKFGWAFMPQAIGWWTKSGLERLIIGSVFGTILLGNYVLAFQIVSLLLFGVTAINLTLVPIIGKKVNTREFSYLNRLYLISTCLVLIGALILFFIAKLALNQYFSDYILSKDYIIFALFSLVPHAISLILVNELYFLKQEKLVAKLILSIFICQSIVSYAFAQFFEVEVLFISSAVFSALLTVSLAIKIKDNRRNSYIKES